MNTVSMEDVAYLTQQSSERVNMILSGMTALMNDTDNKVAVMESQGWFQRMVKTVTGKNKLTQNEIRQNHDKLNAYMSEAIAELYHRNCIDHEVMMSLGTQINEIYAEHVKLKQMLGSFVQKLNEKIDSVDNFHLLVEEIAQGMYDTQYPILSVVKVLSMMDKRTLLDKRKCNIVIQALRNKGILNATPFTLFECFSHVMNLSEEEVGKFYLEVGTIRANYFAEMLLSSMDKLYFLSGEEQRFVNKPRVIRKVFATEDYNEDSPLTTEDIFDEFLSAKQAVVQGLIPISEVQFGAKLQEAEQLYLDCKLDEALELFKTLAEKGVPRAMYFMGEYHVQPQGHVIKDRVVGRQWRQRGYEQGDLLATVKYAYSLSWDDKERSDRMSSSFEAIRKLAEEGDVFAQYELSDLYISGYGTPKNLVEGIKWLRKSAEAGFWRAIDSLGDAYYYGRGVNQDYSEAIKYYKSGVDLGYANSLFNLGFCYYMGKGVAEDDFKALELFNAAYEAGSGEAARMIGTMYNNGYGVTADPAQALSWMQKSVAMGCIRGQYELGNYYYEGIGTPVDIEKAKEWYIKASNNNNDEATTQLGLIAMEELDYEKAVQWYRKAAENGHDDAQNRLGCRYEEGQGVEQDREEAFKWFMKAALQGHMKAQANVGRCYHDGTGVEVNHEQAKAWLLKSSAQGWETADYHLNNFYGISK